MPIPAPFIPAAHSAGILTNIASDLLKRHFNGLESTLVGRRSKWAVLIKPDFNDRLRDTLSTALNFYYKTYLRYKRACITALCRDPAIVRRTEGCILDRAVSKSKKIARLSCHVTLSETKGLVFPMARCFACAPPCLRHPGTLARARASRCRQHDMRTDFDMVLGSWIASRLTMARLSKPSTGTWSAMVPPRY
jgi:hypothetical protein